MFPYAVPQRVFTALEAPIPRKVHRDFAITSPIHYGHVVAAELLAYRAKSGFEETSVISSFPETVLMPCMKPHATAEDEVAAFPRARV